jgi:hypothetical protein
MQRIIVTGPVIQLIAGIVGLTKQQAAARLGSLTDLGEGFYQIEKPVQFKRGEELGYDGDINKALADMVEDLNPELVGLDEQHPVKPAKRTKAE